MQRAIRAVESAELSGLLFLHAMAMGAWFVPLGPVLDSHGLQSIKPFAFATAAVAAFVSPLLFGAVADRHVSPVRVMRWLAFGTAVTMTLTAIALRTESSRWLLLSLIQLNSLLLAPTWSLSNTIVLARLSDSQRQFGPIRALGTIGWMAGCWLVSALHADTTTAAMFTSASVWIAVALFTFRLPSPAPLDPGPVRTVRERLGLDALALLKERDHRVVFLTTALFAIPLAAFFPFTPTHLQALGLERTAAWMSIGQATEIIAMFGLASVLGRWRLKWTLAAGLSFGSIRYFLCGLNSQEWVLAGVSLHGLSFTLFFITSQIYLNERIDPAWSARAQALLSLMHAGVGSLIGFLGTGWWFHFTSRTGDVNWPLFWNGLGLVVAMVLTYFIVAYRGRGQSDRSDRSDRADRAEAGLDQNHSPRSMGGGSAGSRNSNARRSL